VARDKYIYNAETLSYEKVTRSTGQKIKRSMLLLVPGVLVAVGAYLLISPFYKSQKEISLERKNQQLITQYEIVNHQANAISQALQDIQYRDDNIYRVMLEADPVAEPLRQAGIGGTKRYRDLESFANAGLVIDTRNRLDKLEKQLAVQSESFDEVVKLAATKEDMLASIPSVQPVANKDLKRMASGFGMRLHPIHKIQKFHEGMDFTAPTGTEIYATGNGTITFADYKSNGFGIHVVIDHGYGYETVYAHMSQVKVRKGQKISRGDVIGLVGNTGLSAGPHLHYEVHKGGEAVNPANFYFNDLSPEEYEKMLKLSRNPTQSFD